MEPEEAVSIRAAKYVASGVSKRSIASIAMGPGWIVSNAAKTLGNGNSVGRGGISTVITNSKEIEEVFGGKNDVDLLMVAGKLHAPSRSLIPIGGAEAYRNMGQSCDAALFSVWGMTFDPAGVIFLVVPHPEEKETVEGLISIGQGELVIAIPRNRLGRDSGTRVPVVKSSWPPKVTVITNQAPDDQPDTKAITAIITQLRGLAPQFRLIEASLDPKVLAREQDS